MRGRLQRVMDKDVGDAGYREGWKGVMEEEREVGEAD